MTVSAWPPCAGVMTPEAGPTLHGGEPIPPSSLVIEGGGASKLKCAYAGAATQSAGKLRTSKSFFISNLQAWGEVGPGDLIEFSELLHAGFRQGQQVFTQEASLRVECLRRAECRKQCAS